MVDNLVSVRRYVRAMLAASDRSECLGLVVVAGRPADIHTAPPAHGAPSLAALLGPYLGVARPVSAGHEGAGVVLPEAGRVLADGLDAHCWPGSEAAFRDELGAPPPADWAARRGRGGAADVAVRAAAELAAYVGVDARAMPAVVVLDPVTRRGVVVSLVRGSSVWAFGRRLVEEMADWPQRRLGVVEALVAARLERARLDHPRDPRVVQLAVDLDAARAETDDHRRAVATARCHDELRDLESRRRPPAWDAAGDDGSDPVRHDGDGYRRRAELDGTIVRLRGDLEHGDRSVSAADAAARAARAEVGHLRSSPVRAPEALVGWRIERLTAPGVLSRMLSGGRGVAAT